MKSQGFCALIPRKREVPRKYFFNKTERFSPIWEVLRFLGQEKRPKFQVNNI